MIYYPCLRHQLSEIGYPHKFLIHISLATHTPCFCLSLLLTSDAFSCLSSSYFSFVLLFSEISTALQELKPLLAEFPEELLPIRINPLTDAATLFISEIQKREEKAKKDAAQNANAVPPVTLAPPAASSPQRAESPDKARARASPSPRTKAREVKKG